MISLHRNPCIEVFDNASPVYKTICANLAEAKKELPAYIPQLLGVIRQNGAPEFLYNANAYKTLYDKKYYCIDYYFSLDGTTFHHTTSLGYNENAPNKEALIACFDPKQEAARVRFVIDCLKEGLDNPAKFWVPSLLQEPVTESNKTHFKTLLEHLKATHTYPEIQNQLTTHIQPPTAPTIVITSTKTKKETSRELVTMGKQYESGEAKDPFKAERCYWRAICLDPKNAPARRNLALLIYSGQTCYDPTLELSKKILEEAYPLAKQNYALNHALAEIYFYGSSTIQPNSTKAIQHLKACLKKNSQDKWVTHSLECLKNRKEAEETESKEETAVLSIASFYAVKAVESLWNGEIG